MTIQQNLINTIQKYKYLHLLPNIEKEKRESFTTLTFTFLALIFFGFFAMNPTLSTIANLRKQLEDDTLVSQQLDQKITNLGILQGKYAQIQNDIPVVFRAIPEKSSVPFFTGQLQAIANTTGVSLTKMQVSSVEIANTTPQATPTTTVPTVDFSISAQGSHANIINFLQTLATFDRLVLFNNFSLSSSTEKQTDGTYAEQLDLSGTFYYQQQGI